MSQEFLLAAERVLRSHQEPLLIKDIVQKALDNQLLSTDGKTPINTMRARLAEHIRKLGDSSFFVRVDPNKFALREWNIIEYKSKPFEKQEKNEIVVCISRNFIDKHKRFFGFSKDYHPYLKEISELNNILLLPREAANKRSDIKQLVSYVILKDKNGKILSFVRGNYGQKESLLKGVLCIGFGGHANKVDLDLFGINDAGIKNSAHREISEEIKNLKIFNLKHIGVINDDSSSLGVKHFAFVFEARLPVNFDEKTASREMSINKLRLMNFKELWERFHELEFWSQLIVKSLMRKPEDFEPVFIKTKIKNFGNGPLAIIGEIGSGKSEVCQYLSKKFKLPLVSSRKCVERLIKVHDFGTSDRSEFQTEAFKLISTKQGIQELSSEIKKELLKMNTNCILIDGIRHLETFNLIQKEFPNISILYIDVPRDTAYRLYSTRSTGRKVSIHDFRHEREHKVEQDITLFKTRADAYLFNGENLLDLYRAIKNWWNESNEV